MFNLCGRLAVIYLSGSCTWRVVGYCRTQMGLQASGHASLEAHDLSSFCDMCNNSPCAVQLAPALVSGF